LWSHIRKVTWLETSWLNTIACISEWESIEIIQEELWEIFNYAICLILKNKSVMSINLNEQPNMVSKYSDKKEKFLLNWIKYEDFMHLKWTKDVIFIFFYFSFFSSTKSENRRAEQVLPGVGVLVGGRKWYGKQVGGWIQCKKGLHMYVNAKMIPVEGEQWRGWILAWYIWYICKNLYKCHNVLPPSTTKEK
jgi:hypothetical protein